MDNKGDVAGFIFRFSLFLLLCIPVVVVFFSWKESLSFGVEIDSAKFGTFGDFIGGVLGSIWSLCGVWLFYFALKEQRDDFKNNKASLDKQIEALDTQCQEFKLQRKEFSLQREELQLSRQVIIEQSRTLMQQRMDSIYFSLVDLYIKTIANLNEKKPDYFKYLKERFHNDSIVYGRDPVEDFSIVKKIYNDVYWSLTRLKPPALAGQL